MEAPAILYDVSTHVCVITFNRPEVMNALSGTMREELAQALQRAETDPTVRCVLLTGAGRAFCAGGNISNMVELQERQDTRPMTERLALAARVVRQMRSMSKVVIAAVNGPAVGAGMNIALACDLRWGSEAARFGESFVKIGLVPDWGGFYFLPRLVGISRAMELMMTGEIINAEEALRSGIISRIFPQQSFRDDAMKLACQFAAGPALTLARIKQGVYRGATSTLDEALAYEQEAQREVFLSADAKEGMRAFLEKRPPRFGQEE